MRRAVLPRFAALACAAFVGCIDPQSDYNAFVARAPAPDAAPLADDAQVVDPCSVVLAGNPSGTFYGACLTTANSHDIKQATYVKLDATVVKNADGTASVTSRITSLVYEPTNVSQTIGATSSPPTATISASCTYVLEAGTIVIPAQANMASTELTLSNTRYRGKLLTPDSSCTALDATLTSPISLDLTMGGNYCIFRRPMPDGSITLFTLDEINCPGAPPQP